MRNENPPKFVKNPSCLGQNRVRWQPWRPGEWQVKVGSGQLQTLLGERDRGSHSRLAPGTHLVQACRACRYQAVL